MGVGWGVRMLLARRLWAITLGGHRRMVLRRGWGHAPGPPRTGISPPIPVIVAKTGRRIYHELAVPQAPVTCLLYCLLYSPPLPPPTPPPCYAGGVALGGLVVVGGWVSERCRGTEVNGTTPQPRWPPDTRAYMH